MSSRNRDSLVFDVLESIRPQVETWLLDWSRKSRSAEPTSSKLKRAIVVSTMLQAQPDHSTAGQ